MRTGLALIALALLAAGAAPDGALGGLRGSATVKPPNVVVITTDDQTAASVSAMPKLARRLAGQGVSFSNSFASFPLCCPSRATLLTGQYAHNHGVLGNGPPLGGFGRLRSRETLPVWLQEAGYYTSHIGKYLNLYGKADPTKVPPGWTDWRTSPHASSQRVYEHDLNVNGRLVRFGSEPADYKQDVLTRMAVRRIERRSDAFKPFYLQVDYTAPHQGGPDPNPQPPADCEDAPKPAPRHADAFNTEPLPMPSSFNELDVSDKPAQIQDLPLLSVADQNARRARYRCELESLQSVDDGVAAIVAALRERRVLGRTLIIFTSDNGFHAGEHRVRGGKGKVYEESVRVPLIIRGPGIPRGQTVTLPAVNADVAPTVVDAADAVAGVVPDGTSLLPLAATPSLFAPRSILLEATTYFETVGYGAVRTSRYVFVRYVDGEEELYDLALDPAQLESRHDDPDYASIRAQLDQRLQQLTACVGAGCRDVPDLAAGPAE